MRPDEANARLVFSALGKFGAPLAGLSPKDFSQKGFFYTIGMAPLRIDIRFDIEGVDFDACYSRRVESNIGGLVINFIAAEDLVINKEAAGRYQDLADAEKLRLTLDRASGARGGKAKR